MRIHMLRQCRDLCLVLHGTEISGIVDLPTIGASLVVAPLACSLLT